MPALRNLYPAELPGPVVNILEQVLVNGLQVRQIEVSVRNAFADALRDQPPLGAIKSGSAANAQLVFKDGVIRRSA